MLIHEGAARTGRTDERLAWTFAAIAGALNAAGFYAFGAYSANMTGNVSSLADHLGLGEARMALYGLLLVAAFMSGAAMATLLVAVGRWQGLRGVYAYAVLVEALLLTALGCAAPWLAEGTREAVLSLGLGFVLGLQNATVTQITNARVRTTHVTGTMTDIGIGLVQCLARHPGADRARLRLHLVTAAAFLAGGIAGVVAFKAIGTALLIVTGGLLAALALPGISSARRLQLTS
ncbi:YoaK family protein [Methylobacterium aerolatum]|uniref:Uncharacterized membrane protein YoaK (UPF0700 family) n=1 Tax=Methylobacterium aerolatum TaxID=418708 RepID=A0ABU0HWI9_9HYPH|nr:YoaK family protein [Methylobacterium aerolatum]MDQ0446700.1 uncharacterized membrane protein YoaK (UPF0700 family) [Methylobacterium aerolatum]GJD33667.1 hypothetical protein FMGBMHLM_0559 [Methylobacterium aerolatum]